MFNQTMKFMKLSRRRAPVSSIARLSISRILVFQLIICSMTFGLPLNRELENAAYSSEVVRFDSPPSVTEFPIPTANSRPFQITGGPDGNFWFCETISSKVGRVTTAGVFTEFPLAPGSSPFAIASGNDGNLWFTETNANKIGRITPTGTLTEYPIPSPASGPRGITNGPDGNLWFTESNANKIGRITPSATITEFPLTSVGSFPFQITTGADGNLWFTELNTSRIGRITPTGAITEFQIPTANAGPSGITLGPDGSIWFTEYNANKIGRITPSGSFIEYLISTPNSFPFAITTAGDGNLYYTQQGAFGIEQFSPATQTFGIRLGVSGGPSGIFALPANGSNQFLGFVTADANKFGVISVAVSPCQVMLDKIERFFDAQGKKVAIHTGHSNCKPSATSNDTWVVINEVGFVPETGVCAIDYTVQPNPSSVPRTTTITFGDKVFTVHQAGNGGLPSVEASPTTTPSGGQGFRITLNRAGSSNSSDLQIEAAGFTSNSRVGWNGEDRPTNLVSSTQLTADISAADIAAPGTATVTVFDVSPGGGTSPPVTFTITQGPDFSISFDQSTLTGQAGTKARVTVNINRTGGFTGNVTVTPPAPAGGIKPKPPDPVTTIEGSASFKLKIGAGAASGPHQLIFTARDDSGRTRTATITLVVQ